jgi:anti-anti-sigma regulatory factor
MLRVLLHTHVLAHRNGAGLHLAALQRAPAHLLRVTGLDGTLTVHAGVEEAIRVEHQVLAEVAAVRLM